MRKNRTNEKIRKKRDLKNLFRSKRVRVEGARLFYRRNEMAISRTLIVPRKKFGNAVQRNYIKRVGREILKICRKKINPGYDIALEFHSGKYSYKDRMEQVLSLLQKTPIQSEEKDK